jgi:hypothetical protein
VTTNYDRAGKYTLKAHPDIDLCRATHVAPGVSGQQIHRISRDENRETARSTPQDDKGS